MKGVIEFLFKINEKQFKRRGLHKLEGLALLKEKLFFSTMQIVLFVGFFACLFGIIQSLRENLLVIVVIDSVVYLALLVMYLDNKIATIIKKYILLLLTYLLGVFLLIMIGPYGAGLIWLIGFSILATVFLGFQPALYTILINVLTILLLGIGIRLELFRTPFFIEYTVFSWTATAVNLIVVNSISTLSLVYLIRGLEKSFLNEQELKQKLKKKSERLIGAKMRAEESDQLKSAFLANISHEFRTPMNSIIGFTEMMLLTDPSEEKKRRYLENIQYSGEQLLQIINNTIEYSKIEMGTIDLDTEKISISQMLESIYEQLKNKCPENVSFEFINVNGDKQNEFIITDRERLRQVFANLLYNAFKFTTQGKIEFGRVDSAHEDFYKFIVSDTGIGIKKEKQKDIFTRFHKEDDFKEGTGLGLSISATLIAHMGGRIWVDSEPGLGTQFHFILPKKLVIREL